MEEELWRSGQAGGMKKKEGIVEGISFCLKSFTRNLRKAARQAPGKHPGGTQQAPGGRGGDDDFFRRDPLLCLALTKYHNLYGLSTVHLLRGGRHTGPPRPVLKTMRQNPYGVNIDWE